MRLSALAILASLPSAAATCRENQAICSNECSRERKGTNLCDDGGSGSSFSNCVLGSDCRDCGPRCPFEHIASSDEPKKRKRQRRMLTAGTAGSVCAGTPASCNAGLLCSCASSGGRRLFGAPSSGSCTCVPTPPPPSPPMQPPTPPPLTYGTGTGTVLAATLSAGDRRLDVFTATGTFSVAQPVTVAHLLLVGGGGGCAGKNYHGGGGGAGGLVLGTDFVLAAGTYDIVIGVRPPSMPTTIILLTHVTGRALTAAAALAVRPLTLLCC